MGQILDLSRPQIMGILNVTPDSFFDGGEHNTLESAIARAGALLDAGASIIDIGGMSSRPGAIIVEPQEEMDRVLPVIGSLKAKYRDIVISIDTIHSSVAADAIKAGASIVNDISGGRYDPEIVGVAAGAGAPFVCMHMQGLPQTMQKAPSYHDVVHEVLEFFVERVELMRKAGVADIILDPGFGFGKTVDHNYELLIKLGVFQILEMPVLAGISRKSMICKVLNVSPKDALNGTTALHMVALENGANILRVHDVAQAKEVIALYEQCAIARSHQAGEIS